MIAAGYDFWIGPQWSAGVLGRASYASCSAGGDPDTLKAWVLGLAGSITYH